MPAPAPRPATALPLLSASLLLLLATMTTATPEAAATQVTGATTAAGATRGPVAETTHPAPDARSLAASGASSERVRLSTERALEALGRHVKRQSRGDALRLAFHSYFSFRERHPGEVRKPYFFYVDYGLDNRTPRGWVFDMEALALVEGPFTVAHGSGSSAGRNAVPTEFSNRPGSYQSSLGLYLAQETYGFRGRAGGKRYTSIGLRMKGVSGPFNDAARRRGIVSHGAPYVTVRDAGRSQGCPAVEQDRARRLLPKLANGGMVFLFSPHDQDWLREGPWVSGIAAGE